ncbi:hypothetical protein MUG91_G42n152 [Manis pentadactyla]|nr:hypothetical protein MUG91_G42n152 [Manis pentadactyla]
MTVSCWSNFPLWFFKTTRTDGIEWEFHPATGANVSDSDLGPAPGACARSIGQRFSPGEHQRGGGEARPGHVICRRLPRPLQSVGPCLQRTREVPGPLPGGILGEIVGHLKSCHVWEFCLFLRTKQQL